MSSNTVTVTVDEKDYELAPPSEFPTEVMITLNDPDATTAWKIFVIIAKWWKPDFPEFYNAIKRKNPQETAEIVKQYFTAAQGDLAPPLA